MDRIVAMVISIAAAILILVVIVGVLSIKLGPPQGPIAGFIEIIGKVFGF